MNQKMPTVSADASGAQDEAPAAGQPRAGVQGFGLVVGAAQAPVRALRDAVRALLSGDEQGGGLLPAGGEARARLRLRREPPLEAASVRSGVGWPARQGESLTPASSSRVRTWSTGIA
jgi:hypothetical protein